MKMGTKSVLYGAHCFFIHPWFVALAWWKLYGFPWDPRLWVAFFVHDLGYWGKPNMDGKEGEEHVLWGAGVMRKLFDRKVYPPWRDLCMYHSRYWAKKWRSPPSRLCFADKWAFVITPAWLYLTLVRMTGEWREYAAAHNHEVGHNSALIEGWYYPSRDYVKRWVLAHISGEEDTWTIEKLTS